MNNLFSVSSSGCFLLPMSSDSCILNLFETFRTLNSIPCLKDHILILQTYAIALHPTTLAQVIKSLGIRTLCVYLCAFVRQGRGARVWRDVTRGAEVWGRADLEMVRWGFQWSWWETDAGERGEREADWRREGKGLSLLEASRSLIFSSVRFLISS